MFNKLALVVSCVCSLNIPVAEGRFDHPDNLGHAPQDLQYAFIIFRHGIRTPIRNIYSSEEEYRRIWQLELGQLTEDGQRLMVHVGRSLKTRYHPLVKDYARDHVTMTATRSARSTMSTYLVSAGMFAPTSPVIHEVPHWQPVPVYHSAGYDKHHLFDEMEGKTSCPRYIKIRDSIISQELDILNEHQKTDLQKINQELGKSQSPVKAINNFEDLFNVWDVYYMEQLSEKELEGWAKNLMPAMTQLAKLRMWMRMHGKMDRGHSILQYHAAPILAQIINEIIHQKTTCLHRLMDSGSSSATQEDCIRLHFHGSHDLTVGALMYALTDQKNYLADPGDAVIIEADKHGKIKLLLYSPLAKTRKLQELSLKRVCNANTCTLEQLIVGLKQLGLLYSEEEWTRRCEDLEGAEHAEWDTSLRPKN